VQVLVRLRVHVLLQAPHWLQFGQEQVPAAEVEATVKIQQSLLTLYRFEYIIISYFYSFLQQLE